MVLTRKRIFEKTILVRISLKSLCFLLPSAICAGISLSLLEPAEASWLSEATDKGSAFVNRVGGALASAVDITDKKSAVRRVLREADITSPNSTACKALTTEAAGTAAEAAGTANGYPGAGTAVISVIKATCSKSPAQRGVLDTESGVADAVTVEWLSRVKIKELEANRDVATTKIVQDSLVQLEQARQNGEVQRVIAVQNALVEMNRANNGAEIEKAKIGLEAQRINADAAVRVEQLRKEGRVREAEILNDRILKQEQAIQDGQSTRIKIENDTILAVTNSNNAVEMKKAELNVAENRDNIIGKLAEQGIGGIFSIVKEQEITRRLIALAEIDLKKEEFRAKNNPSPNPPLSPNPPPLTKPDPDDPVALVTSWEMEVVACKPKKVVRIRFTNGETVCAKPNSDVKAGRYRYDAKKDKLIKL